MNGLSCYVWLNCELTKKTNKVDKSLFSLSPKDTVLSDIHQHIEHVALVLNQPRNNGDVSTLVSSDIARHRLFGEPFVLLVDGIDPCTYVLRCCFYPEKT